MARQCGLRNGAETERLCGQHEIAYIGPAIDRAVDSERLVGMNNGDMRCAKEIIVFQRLPAISRLVAARDAERVVKLEAALTAAFEIDSEIFARRRKIMVVAGARSGLGIDQFA